MIITPYIIHDVEKIEKIYNIYIKNEYDKFTDDLVLNYFTMLKKKDELKIITILNELLGSFINNINKEIETNIKLKKIKNIKTNDDYYINNNIDKKEINKIVSSGKEDDILYIFYIFNMSYYVKKIIYSNILLSTNNNIIQTIPMINMVYKNVILRYNNNIMIYNIENIDIKQIEKFIEGKIKLTDNSYLEYDENKSYKIDYLYNRRNQSIERFGYLVNNLVNTNNEI